jgi:hypothetical protein
MAFGEVKRPPASHLIREAKRFFRPFDRGEPIGLEGFEAPAMPTTEPERSAEAIRRALPELIMLDRYERRAGFLGNSGHQRLHTADRFWRFRGQP